MTAEFATVHTASYVLAQTIAKKAVDESCIAGFFGAPGTGKTHALRAFRETTPVESVYVTAAPSPGRKEIFEEILRATTGATPDVSARQLRRECEEVLADHQRVVIIDECQHLSYLWHQQLRSLHDRPDARFALLLAGGANAERTLKRDPQLFSRVAMQVHFSALEGDELLRVLNLLHPVLTETDDELLAEIDLSDCRGNLRNWTTFVSLALPLVANTRSKDRLTPKVARAVFALRGVR